MQDASLGNLARLCCVASRAWKAARVSLGVGGGGMGDDSVNDGGNDEIAMK